MVISSTRCIHGISQCALALALATFGPAQLSAQAVAQDSVPHVTVIRAARMLDPRSGAVTSNAVVIVGGDKIRTVGANVAVPAGAKVVDLGNMILLPGMIDCHTHLLQNYKPGLVATVPT